MSADKDLSGSLKRRKKTEDLSFKDAAMLDDDRYMVTAEVEHGSSYGSEFHQMATTPPLDSDAIKMFIGQIPKSMEEDDLRKFLETYGPVHDLNILRDRQSGQSKGCAFVTFCTRKDALAAQMALHNLKIMPGLSHPIQMKPADGQLNSVEERRLFVGMLSKKLSEADVTMMFHPYGTIDDCVVLKDVKGDSKGCAFVTFASKHCAQNAIKSMHHSQTMEGCKMPLVVKIADTQKDKDVKRFYQTQQQHQQQHQHQQPYSASGLPGQATQQTSQYLSMLQQALPNSNLASLAALGNLGTAGLNPSQLQQFMVAAATLAPLLQTNPGLAAVFAALGSASASGPNNAASSAPNLALLQQLAAVTTGNQMNATNCGGASNSSSNLCGMDTMSQYQTSACSSGSLQSSGFGSVSPGFGSSMSAYGCSAGGMASGSLSSSTTDMMNKAYSGFQQYMAGLPNTMPTSLQSPSSPASNQSKGPEGANLFIYHLPREFRDPDLAQMFIPFGSVISAKVFIDKNTNQSKCFGFVSFESSMSAQSAIQAMNGFQIGSKRLKVSLKNSKADSKPY